LPGPIARNGGYAIKALGTNHRSLRQPRHNSNHASKAPRE
jgi:hypothetical protein